jgi:predicted  nucleic acid-binding Zn-ribbon protein
MDNVQINQNMMDDSELDRELKSLLDEAEKLNLEAEADLARTEKELDEIESSVDASISKIETIHSELDEAEVIAGNELDQLVLQQIEDLTTDENDSE